MRELISLFAAAPGLVSARVCTLDEEFVATFPSDSQWIEALQDSVGKWGCAILILPPLSPLHLPSISSPADPLLQYVQMAVHTTQLPLAKVALQMALTEGGYGTHSATCVVCK